jgi:hypothetical protein
MDFAPDGGIEWRKHIQQELKDLSIIWLDPTNKPTDEAVEDIENRQGRLEEKRQGRYDDITAKMSRIRKIDLRLVDLADFLIVHLDLSIYSVGTYNELFEADRQSKPILIHMEGGKEQLPDWLFATIPHEMVFSTWEDLIDYVRHVATAKEVRHFNRWKFFDYGKLHGMDRIPLTKSKVARIDPADYYWLSKHDWCAVTQGSRKWRAMRKTVKNTTRYMHQDIAEHLGWKNATTLEIDHINGDPLDNRRDNLRVVTHTQNCHNRSAQINSRTQHKGVSYETKTRKYTAEIKVGGVRHRLGRFSKLADANTAIELVGRRLMGDYYRPSSAQSNEFEAPPIHYDHEDAYLFTSPFADTGGTLVDDRGKPLWSILGESYGLVIKPGYKVKYRDGDWFNLRKNNVVFYAAPHNSLQLVYDDTPNRMHYNTSHKQWVVRANRDYKVIFDTRLDSREDAVDLAMQVNKHVFNGEWDSLVQLHKEYRHRKVK